MGWEAVDYKLQEAEFFLRKMQAAIVPPRPDPRQGALLAGGNVVIGHAWDQEGFYYYLDAFLTAARSVPDVIEAQFGKDYVLARRISWWRKLILPIVGKPASEWFRGLTAEEQNRREKFSRRFRRRARNVHRHALSHTRNLTVHRTGIPAAEVRVTGRWGVVNEGDAVRPVPEVELPPDPEPAPGAAPLPVGLPRHYIPVRPRADDFFFNRHLANGGVQRLALFGTCNDFLAVVRALAQEAKALDQVIHADRPLTPPPLYELP